MPGRKSIGYSNEFPAKIEFIDKYNLPIQNFDQLFSMAGFRSDGRWGNTAAVDFLAHLYPASRWLLRVSNFIKL
jgi:hypothetical protein